MPDLPVCPYCGSDPVSVAAVPLQIGLVTLLLTFCVRKTCRKLLGTNIVKIDTPRIVAGKARNCMSTYRKAPESELRRRAIERLVKRAGVSGLELRRLGDYCDIAYRKGYFTAQQRAAKEQREQAKRFAQARSAPVYISIETDTPMECPVCFEQILAGVKHEHGKARN